MKICLFVVGKTNHNYLSPGIEEYSRRVNRYVPFAIQYIADAKNTRNLTQAQQKVAEGQNLLAAFEPSDCVVLLDEHGKEMVDFTLEKEYERSVAEKKKTDNIVPMTVKETSTYEVNAAHADDYMSAPDELKKLEEDIMDDENF